MTIHSDAELILTLSKPSLWIEAIEKTKTSGWIHKPEFTINDHDKLKQFQHFYVLFFNDNQIKDTYVYDESQTGEYNDLKHFVHIMEQVTEVRNQIKIVVEQLLETHELVEIANRTNIFAFISTIEPLPGELEFKLQTGLNYWKAPLTSLYDVIHGEPDARQ